MFREFTFSEGDKFYLTAINSADANGKAPLVKIEIKGHLAWQGEHPIAPGAYKVDFVADLAYDLTPLHAGFAAAINQVATAGLNAWEVGIKQSVMARGFVPFELTEGEVYVDYDLIYIFHDLLFMGSKNVDGQAFDKPEFRPTNLQIPLARR